MTVIDVNADLGEGFGVWRLGDDAALLDVITSANVACGFHAGDPLIMRRVCAAAVERGVTIGAQVSYWDLAGFGRREMDVAAPELTAEILYQLSALDGIARAEGGRVAYVKPHGALYNRVARDPVQARAVADAVRAYDPSLPCSRSRGPRCTTSPTDSPSSPSASPTAPTRRPARSCHDVSRGRSSTTPTRSCSARCGWRWTGPSSRWTVPRSR